VGEVRPIADDRADLRHGRRRDATGESPRVPGLPPPQPAVEVGARVRIAGACRVDRADTLRIDRPAAVSLRDDRSLGAELQRDGVAHLAEGSERILRFAAAEELGLFGVEEY